MRFTSTRSEILLLSHIKTYTILLYNLMEGWIFMLMERYWSKTQCDRCSEEVDQISKTMSRINTDCICMECLENEEAEEKLRKELDPATKEFKCMIMDRHYSQMHCERCHEKLNGIRKQSALNAQYICIHCAAKETKPGDSEKEGNVSFKKLSNGKIAFKGIDAYGMPHSSPEMQILLERYWENEANHR